MIAAAMLRLWGLDRNPLWNDELFSWYIGSLPTPSVVIAEGVAPDVHPPGYFLLLHLLIRYVGDNEALLRLPSALAGIAAVWMLYRLGCRLYSEKEALVASALLAVSWPGVFYAQDARPYALLLLAVIVATYFWIDILRTLDSGERPWPSSIIGYFLAAVGAAYLHYFGLQIVILQGLCTALLFIRQLRAVLTCAVIYGALAITYAPWVPTMLEQLIQHQNFWIKKPELLSAMRWQIFAAFRLPVWQSLLLVVPALILALVAALRAARGRPIRQAILSSDAIAIGWCGVPLLAAYIQSIALTPVLTARNLIVILPALYLLTARGIWHVGKSSFSFLWIGALIAAMGFPLAGYLTEIRKERFDLVASYVVNQVEASSFPIIASTQKQSFFDYYFRKFRSPHRVGLHASSHLDVARTEQFVSKSDGFWFLSGGTVLPAQEYCSYLDSTYSLVKRASYEGAEARLYRKSAGQSSKNSNHLR